MPKASGLCIFCDSFPCECSKPSKKKSSKPRSITTVPLPPILDEPVPEPRIPVLKTRDDFSVEEALEITAIKNLAAAGLIDGQSEEVRVTLRPHERAAVWRIQQNASRES